jgi:hypothetical protein
MVRTLEAGAIWLRETVDTGASVPMLSDAAALAEGVSAGLTHSVNVIV